MNTVKNLLKELNLGNSVAEFENSLESYFVETETFNALVSGKIDIVAGDKGTGKTALYKILKKRYREFKELENIEIIPAFNPSGNPVFQSITQKEPLSEAEYNELWKAYILSICGNWLIGIYGPTYSPSIAKLAALLEGLDFLTGNDSPPTVFARIVAKIGQMVSWKSVSTRVVVQPDGSFEFEPKVEFGAEEEVNKIPHEAIDLTQALTLLNRCFIECEIIAWIAIDRLDEAFQGFENVEIPALRALFRTYLDFNEFSNLKIKLFVRRDLFRRIVGDGFVNLTHINAMKKEIIWDEEDLLNLLCRRIRLNEKFCREIGIFDAPDSAVFSALFPNQVDQGLRKPKTWVWVMRRIRDGNDVKPPRNLIDLITFARDAQLRREDRDPREYREDTKAFEPEALRKALSLPSEQRVNDTLLAEAKALAPLVERFRRGKAEHNEESIALLFGIGTREVTTFVKPLIDLGFLEEIKGNYKIPALYREGLEVTQGKGFDEDE